MQLSLFPETITPPSISSYDKEWLCQHWVPQLGERVQVTWKGRKNPFATIVGGGHGPLEHWSLEMDAIGNWEENPIRCNQRCFVPVNKPQVLVNA